MKNLKILSLLLSFSLFTACNEGNQEVAEEEVALEEEPTTIAEELAEGNDVEPPKIPVEYDTTIMVKAVGNTKEEMAFVPQVIVMPANGRAKVILENTAEDEDMIHNIVFVKKNRVDEVAMLGEESGEENDFIPDLPAVFEGSELAEPGETVEMFITAPHQSGEYAFICTYPGHWKEMIGSYIVEPVAKPL